MLKVSVVFSKAIGVHEAIFVLAERISHRKKISAQIYGKKQQVHDTIIVNNNSKMNKTCPRHRIDNNKNASLRSENRASSLNFVYFGLFGIFEMKKLAEARVFELSKLLENPQLFAAKQNTIVFSKARKLNTS